MTRLSGIVANLETRLSAAASTGPLGTSTTYVAVSAVACVVDFYITLDLTRSGEPAWLAASTGYLLGLWIHWVLSCRFVFARELARTRPGRRRQALLFALSGGVGLGVTVAIYAALTAEHLHPAFAKSASIVVSFVTVYALRRHIVFPVRG